MGEPATKVEKAQWGWMVTCLVCGCSGGYETRTTGSGALRKAKAWRCPHRTCNEIIRLRNERASLISTVETFVACMVPHPVAHPSMHRAWTRGQALLAELRTDSATKVGGGT